MLNLPSSVQIYLASEPADMRKGFDGLSAIVFERGLDIYSGHLFVFVSKRRDRVKIITWDRGGFVLYYKRLERGRFKLPLLIGDTVCLDAGQLGMLLDGVDIKRVHRGRPWRPPTAKVSEGIDSRSSL
jgi:transposase